MGVVLDNRANRAGGVPAGVGGPVLPEATRYVRRPDVSGVGLLRARFTTFEFGSHAHAEYAFGVMERGALVFRAGRHEHRAEPGAMVLLDPETPHRGGAGDPSGYAYRMFYIDAATLHRLLDLPEGRWPSFHRPLLAGPPVAPALLRLHLGLERGAVSRLGAESAFLTLLPALFRGLVEAVERDRAATDQARAVPGVRRAREYLEAVPERDHSLDELAAVAGLSRRHFTRCFRTQVGLSPSEYATQVKLRHAWRLLEAGEPAADVATRLGFADQSHLNRRFKRVFGFPPGQIRAR